MENAAKKGLWGDVAPIVTCYCQLIIGSKRLVLNVETFVSFGQFRTKPLSAKSRELVFQHVTVCAPSSWPSVCPIASISTIQIFVATSLYFTFFLDHIDNAIIKDIKTVKRAKNQFSMSIIFLLLNFFLNYLLSLKLV